LAADDPVGTSAVLYDNLLFETLAELWADDTCHHAGRSTRRKRYDDVDSSVGIAIGGGTVAQSERCQHQAQPN
jgi:hypothetical protein